MSKELLWLHVILIVPLSLLTVGALVYLGIALIPFLAQDEERPCEQEQDEKSEEVQ